MRAGNRSRRQAALVMGAVCLSGAACAVGCGESKPAESPTAAGSASVAAAPPPSSAPSAAASVAVTAPTASAGAPTAAPASPLSTILTTDPNQLAQMYAAAAAAATAAAQAPAAGPSADAADTGLKALASKQAAGMQPDGPVAKGMLQQGGHLEMLVTLQAGKCYSILGYSPVPGVKDLDLHLLAPPFYNILSGEDTTDDNTPIVGKAPNPMCPLIPVPLPYKVDIFAEKGSGPVSVQLYSKTK
jgi:hypothetical protein